MCDLAVTIVLLLLGATSCAHDYDGLTSGDGAMDAAVDTGMDSSDDTLLRDSTPPDTRVTDTRVDDGAPVDAGPCGDLGQRCCAATPCAEGVCLTGSCVDFGGAYQLNGSDACTVPNPFLDACGCPPGFVDQPLLPLDARAGELETIHVCHGPTDVVGAVFRGAYGRQTARPPDWCVTECVANPFTGSCGCPAGSSRSNAYNTHTGTDPSSCRRAAGLCTDTDALPLTFGGAFHDLDDGIGPDCDDTSSKFAICLTNPMTGDCSCPPGFEESRHPITRQDPLAPSRGDILGSCPATFTVCWRNAP